MSHLIFFKCVCLYYMSCRLVNMNTLYPVRIKDSDCGSVVIKKKNKKKNELSLH